MPIPSGLPHIPFVRTGTALEGLDGFRGFKVDPKLIVDLGSGDGSVLRWFHRYFPNARLVGYEIDEALAEKSRTPKVEIINGDMWDADLSDADIIYLYWMPYLMEGFVQQFWRNLKPGALVVSHGFELPEIQMVCQKGAFFVYQKPM